MGGEPDPPDAVPQYVVDALDSQGVTELRLIAEYATDLAAWREQRAQSDETASADTGESDADVDEQSAEFERRDAPPRASRVVKTINDNRYWYWQWRDGEAIRSEYIGPVEED